VREEMARFRSAAFSRPAFATRGRVALLRSGRRASVSGRAQREETLYSLLGVTEKASGREIKQSYRRLAKVTHPDAGGDPEKFKQIAKAYAVLSNEDARTEYDRKMRAERMFNQGGFGGSSVDDAFDFFERQASKQEDFYGLGDLFRDIEKEFSGLVEKDENAVFRKIGEDLLDFLEGKTSSTSSGPDTKAKAKAGGSSNRNGERTSRREGGNGRAGRGASSSRGERSGGSKTSPSPAPSSASFDADLELRELKRQMAAEAKDDGNR